jgi:hypothetical protein
MRSAPPACAAPKIIDVGQLLELIESVIALRPVATGATPRSGGIVSECLRLLGVDHATAKRIQRRRLRELYAAHRLPIRLTLGAALALDAAQRSEWFGLPDEEVLAHALRMSSRLPDLVSDRVMRRVDRAEIAAQS